MRYLKKYESFEGRIPSCEEIDKETNKLEQLNKIYMPSLFKFTESLIKQYGIKDISGRRAEGYITNTESGFQGRYFNKGEDIEKRARHIGPVIRIKFYLAKDDLEGIKKIEKDGFQKMGFSSTGNISSIMYCKDIPLTKYEGQKEILLHYPQLIPVLKEFKILPQIEKEFSSILKLSDWS